MTSSTSDFHVLPTSLGTFVAEVSNKYIIPAKTGSLAIPLADEPAPKYCPSAVRFAHNAALQRLMVERQVTKHWRYARFNGSLPAGPGTERAGYIIAGILTCGLGFCFGPADNAPAIEDTSKNTSGPQDGYFYTLVPEIPCVPQLAFDYFPDPYGTSNFGAGTVAQDCIWIWGGGEKSVAPGGGWAVLPTATPVEMRYDWIWLYTFGTTAAFRKLSHGMTGSTTIGAARARLFTVEREALRALFAEGFNGRAVAVWPPVIVNDVVVA